MAKVNKQGFWISIDSIESARTAARQGVWAAGLVAAITAVLAVISMTTGGMPAGFPHVNAWAFWDVGFFVAVAWGIHKMSRVAAVIGLVLYLIEQIIMRVSYPEMSTRGLVFVGLFIFAFINGIRGTFAYHAFRRDNKLN